MAGKKGIRLPQKEYRNPRSLTTEPHDEQHLKESRREGCAVVAEGDEDKKMRVPMQGESAME